MTFQPSDLSGLVGWYDAQDAATITQSGGFVSQWNDKSSKGINVAQATQSLKPAYTASAINGFPGITFDGVDDRLSVASAQATSVNELTVFVIVANTFTGFQSNFGWGQNGDEIQIALEKNGTNLTQSFWGANESPADILGNTLLTNSTPYYLTYKRSSGGVVTFRANGIDDTKTATQTPATINLLTVGTFIGGDPFNEVVQGPIGEIVVYNRLLTNVEISQVETYLATKWALPLPPSPPVPVTVAQRFQGAGQGLAPDKDYFDKVNAYWQAIEAARDRQRRQEAEQQRIEVEADRERQRIHARMAELRAIKSRKKAERERVAHELALLQADEEQIKATLGDANQAVLAMIEEVNSLIIAMEAYKRRYQASLIMLLLGVN